MQNSSDEKIFTAFQIKVLIIEEKIDILQECIRVVNSKAKKISIITYFEVDVRALSKELIDLKEEKEN